MVMPSAMNVRAVKVGVHFFERYANEQTLLIHVCSSIKRLDKGDMRWNPLADVDKIYSFYRI